MALIAGTLPSDTCYGTPQDLLELFAQYLDVPAFTLNSKVVFANSSTGLTSDVIWINTNSVSNPILSLSASGGFVDYVNNYANNLSTVTTPASGDFCLLSQSSVLKKITYANFSTGLAKVSFSTSSAGLSSDTIWFDTTLASNPILKVTVSSIFVDYINNYATNLPVVTTPAAGDFCLISQSNALKKISYANFTAGLTKVSFSTSSTGLSSDTIWVDTTSASNPILKISASSVFVDYVNNYATNLPIVTTPAAGDFLLISQSNALKKITYNNLITSNANKLLQIVEGSTTSQFVIATTTLTDTGLSVSITPSSVSSRIVVLITQAFACSTTTSNNTGAIFNVLRNVNVIYSPVSANDVYNQPGTVITTTSFSGVWHYQIFDSPNTTSLVTYKVQGRASSAGITLAVQNGSTRSSIIAMEFKP